MIKICCTMDQVELSHPNAELRLLEVFYHKIYKVLDRPVFPFRCILGWIVEVNWILGFLLFHALICFPICYSGVCDYKLVFQLNLEFGLLYHRISEQNGIKLSFLVGFV